MMIPSPLTQSRAFPRKSGVALVITLAMLVLLSAIVLAFFSTVTTDVTASKGYQGSVSARLLADSAVNLVIGEIKDASTKANQAWISQPGLVRTYSATGQPLSAYKLYSSDQMVVDAGSFDPTRNPDDVPPSDGSWRAQSALWTDLNAPVADPTRHDSKGNVLLTYPILDGNHLFTGSDPAIPGPVGQLALSGSGTPDISSFEILNFDAQHPAEMPVKWLYVLKDGTIVPAALGSSATSAKVIIPAGKEKTPEGEVNEPVARMAFWTDDETAKVNLNTASEGTFWDTPICNSQRSFLPPKPPPKGMIDPNMMYEMDLAEYIPDHNEFQRYPGHPATTCLSPILGQQLSLLKPYRPDMIEALYEMVPRISGKNANSASLTAPYAGQPDYSSDGGTRRGGLQGEVSGDTTVDAITYDSDRLYASIDELLFNPVFLNSERQRQALATASSQSDNSREMLEMAKFFLTAQSKAPEQNLFNKPRVAMWPINSDPAKQTTFDKLIAFCSTVGSRANPAQQEPFIFSRNDPNSPTNDFLAGRNPAVYNYLHTLMQSRTPGYPLPGGGSFASKYAADSDQILTEIFDYIRCTNLIDRTEGDAMAYTPPEDDVNTQLSIHRTAADSGRGQVVPIKIGATRGLGRIATISELAIAFVKLPDPQSPNKPYTTPDGQPGSKIEVALVPQLFCPMAGFSALANDIRIHFKSIDMTLVDKAGTPHPLFKNFSSGQTQQPDLYDVGRITDIEDNESKVGGYIGARSLLEEGTISAGRYPLNQGSPPDSVPPTDELILPKSAGSFSFFGTVNVEIHAPHNAPAVIQTFAFNFGSSPGQTVPMPTDGSGTPFSNGPGAWTKTNTRCSGQYWNGIFDGQDTVRSVQPVNGNVVGDMRIVAASATVDKAPGTAAPLFGWVKNAGLYDNAALGNVHCMRPCWAGVYAGFQCGSLVPAWNNWSGSIDVRPAFYAGLKRGAVNSLGSPGDWDNGSAYILDGAYCNKADEGCRRHEHGRSQASGQYDEDSAPYIGWYWNPQDAVTEQNTFFSPNRQIASPVTFGSLPTGVLRGLGWQTLLFRPAKSYLPGGANHPGSANPAGHPAPPDHLLLDLFWMPVVEPYPISEPFATAGKINLNAQVVPFTNIKRDTGLEAVLKSVKVAALNPLQKDTKGNFIGDYKLCGSPTLGGSDGGGQNVVVRRNIDVPNTIRQIDDRLAKNKPFISASEICDIPLLPAALQGYANTGITSSTPVASFDAGLAEFWNQNTLTGDNSLERPYSCIYPRLTTRSNTYTVHVHVQTLKQAKRTTQTDEFIDGKDLVTGDFRGSFIIERYLDPNTAGFYTDDGSGNLTLSTAKNPEIDPATMLGPYRFRVISSKQFAP